MALKKLDPRLQKAVKEMGYEESTLIQQKTIPLIQQGKDIIGHSKTGSGKTAAFGLPMLEKIKPGKPIQAVILTPTRELCVQVAQALRDFSKYLNLHVVEVYGGVDYEPQFKALKTCEILVGTPGRVLDHTKQKTVSYDNTIFFVLDEADKMFEMGFIEDVEDIMRKLPKPRQTLLFSATMPAKIRGLAERHLNDPAKITGDVYVDRRYLRQLYYNIRPHDKFGLLVHLLKTKKPEGLALVFCGARTEVDTVADNLKKQGINAMGIHGGMDQKKRLRSLEKLRDESINVLVATDVAARGLDIKNVTNVYNWDVPKTSEEYVHRIGRTARAGEKGEAVTLLVERDYENFDRVLRDSSIHEELQRTEPPRFQQIRISRAPRESRGPPGRGGPRRGPSRDGPRRTGQQGHRSGPPRGRGRGPPRRRGPPKRS